MTVAVPGEAGTELESFGDDIGLEDMDASDLVIPRIRIVHTEGMFEDSLTGEKFPELRCILLGVVKQRIMWHATVDDGDLPMCKSPDFEHGFPLTISDKQPKDKMFPWAKSNFKPEAFPPADGINGLVTLPCNSCVFQEWDRGDWKVPPCAEQHTFPLFYTTDDGLSWSPGLFTVQKTGIKPSRTYLSSFASAKRPTFTVETKITLGMNTRGSVTYSVPKFVKAGESDRTQWKEFQDTYRRIRALIRQAPRNAEGDDDAPVESSNENTAPVAAAPPAATAPPVPPAVATPVATAPVAAPPAAAVPAVPSADDDDMPF